MKILIKKITKAKLIKICIVLIGLSFLLAVTKEKPYISNIIFDEVVQYNPKYTRDLASVIYDTRDDKNIKAVIITINSPGGSVVDTETIYNALVKLNEVKPVVVVMEGYAASGGYVLSLPSRKIFAQKTTHLGSIGVISKLLNFSGLLDKIGVKEEVYKSTEIKGGLSNFSKTTERQEQNHIKDIKIIQSWFIELITKHRGGKIKNIKHVCSGGVFFGEEGLKLGLIDAIGDIEDAKLFITQEYLNNKDIPLKTAKKPKRKKSLVRKLFNLIAQQTILN